jgi:phosphoribosylglycinamide formyltransferase-1
MKIAVFVSGNGSNLQALIEAQAKGHLGTGDITLVVSDSAGAFALKRAEKAGIESIVVTKKEGQEREDYDAAVLALLEGKGIELIVLAGFMRILSSKFVEEYEGKILNIHPALLPAFIGTHGIKDAFDHGVKVTGVTVHFVTSELDDGPIILQEAVKVEEDETEESLEEKIHKVEHKLYPEAVRLFTEGKLQIEGRKVKIL